MCPSVVELGHHEGVVALPEAVQIEDQPAEITVGELARLAQEARAPARAPARAEARLGGSGASARAGACGPGSAAAARRVCGMRSGYLIHSRSMLSRLYPDRCSASRHAAATRSAIAAAE